MRACMIGLGQLGLPIAETMAKFHEVIGFDCVPPIQAYLPLASSLSETIKARELIFISVPNVELLSKLNDIVTPDQIIVLVSIVDNVEALASTISNCRFIYNPHFTVENMLSPEKIILATEKDYTIDGETMADIITIKSFYNPMMQNRPKCIMCSFTEANSNIGENI